MIVEHESDFGYNFCLPFEGRDGQDEKESAPRIPGSSRPLRLWRDIYDPLDEEGAAAGDLQQMPSLLHGQAEARGLRWPRRALPETLPEERERVTDALGRLRLKP